MICFARRLQTLAGPALFRAKGLHRVDDPATTARARDSRPNEPTTTGHAPNPRPGWPYRGKCRRVNMQRVGVFIAAYLSQPSSRDIEAASCRPRSIAACVDDLNNPGGAAFPEGHRRQFSDACGTDRPAEHVNSCTAPPRSAPFNFVLAPAPQKKSSRRNAYAISCSSTDSLSCSIRSGENQGPCAALEFLNRSVQRRHGERAVAYSCAGVAPQGTKPRDWGAVEQSPRWIRD